MKAKILILTLGLGLVAILPMQAGMGPCKMMQSSKPEVVAQRCPKAKYMHHPYKAECKKHWRRCYKKHRCCCR